MNCRNVLHSLSAYMDGELRGSEHRLVHEHLTRCKECEAEYQELLQMKRLLGQMRLQQPRADLPDMILSHVAVEADRLAELNPVSWVRRLQALAREALPSPRPALVGTGLGIAFAFLLSLQAALPEDKVEWRARDMTQAAILPSDLAAPDIVIRQEQAIDWLPAAPLQPARAGMMLESAPPVYTPVSNMSPYAPATCEEIDARRGWHRNSQMY